VTNQIQLDSLDQQAAGAFEGYIVRKDLARLFKGQYPVPTYVGEFLLGRYCASTDEEEIREGLGSVWLTFQSQRMMQTTCTAAKNWCPRFS